MLPFNNENGEYYVQYNPNGGWYHSAWHHREPAFINDYIMLTEAITDRQYDQHNINSLHVALENMIMLQNTCKVHGIKFYQQYYMDHTYKDIEHYKTIELSTTLSTTRSTDNRVLPAIHEYVKPLGLTISETSVTAERTSRYLKMS